MIGIDRYGIRHMALNGSLRNPPTETAAAAAQHPVVQLSGGSETGQSSRSRLSAALWSLESAGRSGEDSTDTPETEFTRLSRMSLAERIRAEVLERHQLTEADFKTLSDSDRKAIEDEIREAILRAYGSDREAGGTGRTEQAAAGPSPEPLASAPKTQG